MNLALIHDHLIQSGGAERVLETLATTWPDAPIFTLLYDKKEMGATFPEGRIRTSFLQRMPFALRKYQWMLPLMPAATEQYDLRGFDSIEQYISPKAYYPSIHCMSATAIPLRYLWSETHSYISELKNVLEYSKNNSIFKEYPHVGSCRRGSC